MSAEVSIVLLLALIDVIHFDGIKVCISVFDNDNLFFSIISAIFDSDAHTIEKPHEMVWCIDKCI